MNGSMMETTCPTVRSATDREAVAAAAVSGYDKWLASLGDWRGAVDDFGQEVTELARAWREAHGEAWVTGGTLYDLSKERGLFGWLDRARTDHGRRTAFGIRVLSRIANRVLLSKCGEGWVDG